jgi:hypothetical protein
MNQRRRAKAAAGIAVEIGSSRGDVETNDLAA